MSWWDERYRALMLVAMGLELLLLLIIVILEVILVFGC